LNENTIDWFSWGKKLHFKASVFFDQEEAKCNLSVAGVYCLNKTNIKMNSNKPHLKPCFTVNLEGFQVL